MVVEVESTNKVNFDSRTSFLVEYYQGIFTCFFVDGDGGGLAFSCFHNELENSIFVVL